MIVLRTLSLWLVTALRASPLLTGLLCLTTVAGSVFVPLSVQGVRLTVDAVVQGTSVWPGIAFIAGCLLISSLAASVAGPIGDVVGDRIVRHVHDDLLAMTARIPSMAHHEDPELADRVALIERDAYELGGVFRLLSTLGAITGTVTVVALLWSANPLLCLLLVLALVPAAATARGVYQRERLWRTSERFRRLGAKISDVLSEPRQGIEIRCFGLGPALIRAAELALDLHTRPAERVSRRHGWLTAGGWLLYGLAYGAALGWTFLRARAGQATIGDVTLVLLIGPQISTTAQAITSNITMITTALETFGRYLWLRDYARTHTWAESRDRPPDRLSTGIRLDHVDFAYPSARADAEADPALSLQDVSLELPAGTTVALVGENGAGKSTVVKLLSRLYDPSAGAVLIDGVPLRDLDPAAWRERMSAGFQDFASLELLTADSVGVGDLARRTDRTRIGAAVRAGQAEPVVADLQDGLDTQLGTRFGGGVALSGGQWQRLALARAFMRDRPLLMLLDEPTAALDPEAEHAIYQQYAATARELARSTGAVTVLVSHRFSTVRMADRIVVMAGGRVSETGTHQELVAAGGEYARMFELQARAYR